MSRGPRKIILFFCLGGFMLAVLVLGIGLSSAYLSRNHAERLLQAFRQVRVGSTDSAEALRIIGSFPMNRYDGEGCSEWGFHYDNGILSKLRLTPYTSFDAKLSIKDEIVQEKEVRVFVASGVAALVVERRRGFRLPNGIATNADLSHNVAFSRNSSARVTKLSVYDDNSYGEKERDADWTIDLKCLTQIGGCEDARRILTNVLSKREHDFGPN